MNGEMDGQLTIRDKKESTSDRCGRAGPGHHFTNGQCLADGNKFSDLQRENKCCFWKKFWSCFFQAVPM